MTRESFHRKRTKSYNNIENLVLIVQICFYITANILISNINLIKHIILNYVIRNITSTFEIFFQTLKVDETIISNQIVRKLSLESPKLQLSY